MAIVDNFEPVEPITPSTEQTVTKKKKGFNPDQLRKTIVTKIDKDGFHERTVYYGKDSAGSSDGDWSIAHVTFILQNEDPSNEGGYTVYVPTIDSDGFHNSSISVFPNTPSIEVEVPLYKGSLIISGSASLNYPCILDVDPTIAPIVSGGVSTQPPFDIVITGDGTFTAQAMSGNY